VQKWASQKATNRESWLQALYNRTTSGKGNGSIVFYAFPQEIVDQIVARTGGRGVRVRVPEVCDGEVRIDSEGRVLLLNSCLGPDGQVQEREVFQVQVGPNGDVFRDYGHKGQPVVVERMTNLFIWTKSGRLNYELEPAGEVMQMDFAIDQPPTLKAVSKTPVVKADPPSPPVVSESVFLKGTPVRTKTYKSGRNRVQVMLKDIFNQDGRLYIRYVVENSTKHVYDVRPPQVFMVESPRGPKTLLEQHNLQLTDSEAGKIVGARQVPLELLLQESQSAQVQPGKETVGIIEVKVPWVGQRATVLRLALPDSSQKPIMATLLL
jgi:hypothetical protein